MRWRVWLKSPSKAASRTEPIGRVCVQEDWKQVRLKRNKAQRRVLRCSNFPLDCKSSTPKNHFLSFYGCLKIPDPLDWSPLFLVSFYKFRRERRAAESGPLCGGLGEKGVTQIGRRRVTPSGLILWFLTAFTIPRRISMLHRGKYNDCGHVRAARRSFKSACVSYCLIPIIPISRWGHRD